MVRTALSALAALLSTLLLVVVLSPQANAYTPDSGALFNNPRGSAVAKDRILTHIVKTIDSTPRNSQIKIAAYSNDRPDVAEALIRAHQRGVDVQLVLNDNWTSGATRRLVNVLGRDTNRRSFVAICAGSCRGGFGNQHMKFYLFSRAGQTNDVVMVGSANLTGYGARVQWNDLYTTSNVPELRDLYTKIFEQLVRDRRVASPYVHRVVGDYENEFFPMPSMTAADDPVLHRLDAVRCAATSGTGRNGHTVIRIVMYGWVDSRGLYLAKKVADLDRAGCDVRVILSSPGGRVVRNLIAGGVLVKTADLNLDKDDSTGFDETPFEVFTHQKYMTLSGSYRNQMSHQVWTGSENWSNLGLRNDEVTIRIPGSSTHRAYVANFDYLWANWTRWLDPNADD
jgi:phosphatidylserine/phosphatidylglycerophosphate/cardiolipin synthase-like enzyme